MAHLHAHYVPPKTTDRAEVTAKIQHSVHGKVQPQLYARYVPPKKTALESSESTHVIEPQVIEGETKKRKRGSKAEKSLKKSKHNTEQDLPATNGGSEPAVVGSDDTAVIDVAISSKETPSGERPRRVKKEKSNKPAIMEDDTEKSKKHSAIISKFQKSLTTAGTKTITNANTDEVETEAIELHDLVPIPLPEQGPNPEAFSALAALPPWLTKPFTISSTTTASFSDLNLDSKIIDLLQDKGLTKALPVQAGVLPLVLPTPRQHPGDICVSAATGSGKTLAYVLPIIQTLRNRTQKKLRALIVVPTRELVNQVRETAELCATGTDLQIGTALGTHTFEAEQQALVREGRKYDPARYQALQMKLSGRDLFAPDFLDDEEDFATNHLNDATILVPEHIPSYTSNVDILICTPGRLVQHIKSTQGFTLQDLEWFVIDEADRLLDQSFQEWVDTLHKAMTPDSSKEDVESIRDPYLAGLLNCPSRRPVRKVVLSATMTRDLEKLGSLQLRNPIMVVVEGAETKDVDATECSAVTTGGLQLPATLQEFAVPVSDGSEKPLYLLKLLQQILGDTDVAFMTNEWNGTKERRGCSSLTSDDSDEDSDHSADSDDTLSSITSSSSTSDGESDSSSISSDSDSSDPSGSSSSSLKSSSLAKPAIDTTNPDTANLSTHANANALIFTSTTESAHRLSHLLSLLSPTLSPHIFTLTSTSKSTYNRHILSSFTTPKTQNPSTQTQKQNAIKLLITTDRSSRGLDLPNLLNVINYDIPHNLISYIHRVGRTARAGRSGKAWTLVSNTEAAWFWNDIARAPGNAKGRASDANASRIQRVEGQKVGRVRVGIGGVFGVEMKGVYERALDTLRGDVRGKRN